MFTLSDSKNGKTVACQSINEFVRDQILLDNLYSDYLDKYGTIEIPEIGTLKIGDIIWKYLTPSDKCKKLKKLRDEYAAVISEEIDACGYSELNGIRITKN